ncbi:hypothetical protein ACFE04_017825 [Oxalis oulophora]
MYVRVIRQWTVPSVKPIPTSRKIQKMRMLLLDEHGSKIEATIKDLSLKKFESIIKEEECYVISNCRLTRNVGRTRLSDNKCKSNFILSSNIEEILATTFTEYCYDFVPFGAVGDVIGQLVVVSHIMKGVSSERSIMSINIILEDENNQTLKCTLWDIYPEELSAFMLNHNMENHVIAILHLEKIHDRHGKSTIMILGGSPTSQRLTKLYEPSLDDVFSNPSQLKSIQYVKEFKEKWSFVTYGTVERFDEGKGWFYETCLTRRDGPLCDVCSGFQKIIISRFNVELHVFDQSGSTTFLLFDDAATKVIGGDEIIEGLHGPIPKKTTSLLKRSFLFEIKKNNINLIGNQKYVMQHWSSRDGLVTKFISS